MANLLNEINKKVNGVIVSFISTGIILILLAIMILAFELVLRFVVFLVVLVIAFTFLYGGYKVWEIKKKVKEHFKL
jgi:hypothetical protein